MSRRYWRAKKADAPSRNSAGAPSPLPPVKIEIPAYRVPVTIEPAQDDILTALAGAAAVPLDELRLLIDYHALTIRSGFDELLCLSAVKDVDRYWYQIETVKKVLKRFHCRVLLGDEVGLGKTIEAGMLIKEYLMRGMVRNVLILAPAPLVSQWREEMEMKFGIPFLSTDSPPAASLTLLPANGASASS